MRKITNPNRLAPLVFLLAIMIVAGIAATPATLAKPNAPTARATGNPGEMTISWDRVPGAQYYTVGWINWTQGMAVLDAGGDWTSLFHYSTVLGSQTTYTVSGLVGGDNHHAIIRATDVVNGRFRGGYSEWSGWSSAIQPASPPPPAPGDADSSVLTRPANSPNCRVGQRLAPGASCNFKLGDSNDDWTFGVIAGDNRNGHGILWTPFDDVQVLRSWPNRPYQYSIGDQVFRVQYDNNAWVVRQLN